MADIIAGAVRNTPYRKFFAANQSASSFTAMSEALLSSFSVDADDTKVDTTSGIVVLDGYRGVNLKFFGTGATTNINFDWELWVYEMIGEPFDATTTLQPHKFMSGSCALDITNLAGVSGGLVDDTEEYCDTITSLTDETYGAAVETAMGTTNGQSDENSANLCATVMIPDLGPVWAIRMLMKDAAAAAATDHNALYSLFV